MLKTLILLVSEFRMVDLRKRIRYSAELPAGKVGNRSPIPGKRADFSLFQIVSGTYPTLLSEFRRIFSGDKAAGARG